MDGDNPAGEDPGTSGIEYELKRPYYDIAGTADPRAIAALTSLVPTTQILFGSDNPFVPLAETAEGMTKLGFSEGDLQRITHNNALGLMPQLKRNRNGAATPEIVASKIREIIESDAPICASLRRRTPSLPELARVDVR